MVSETSVEGEPLRKRVRLSPAAWEQPDMTGTEKHEETVKESAAIREAERKRVDDAGADETEEKEEEDTQLRKELRAGITAYVSPNAPGFTGTLKQRYTDFLVNEILPNGTVLHLQSTAVPAKVTSTSTSVTKGPSQVKVGLEPVDHPERGLTTKCASNATPKKDPHHALDISQSEISAETKSELEAIFGERVTLEILKLHQKILAAPDRKPKDCGQIVSQVIEEKDDRTTAHQTVRRIFSGQLDTTTGDNNTITISKAYLSKGKDSRSGRLTAGANRGKGKLGWDELGGEYLHFSLYKENKDTMEVIYFLASQLKLNVKSFQFAGTKDRRAVTVQRVSAYRVHADRLASLNRLLRGARVGDFKHESTGLALGDLEGNEFHITLRDCHFPNEDGLEFEERVELARQVVSGAISRFQEQGFINYYGLQRFGSFSTGTHDVGKKLLQQDLEGAIKLILSYNPSILAAAQAEMRGEPSDTQISSDDRNRALAIHLWENKRNVKEVLQKMPRKFSAESNIIRHLAMSRNGSLTNKHDWQGALSTVQRNLRLMYVHAYQSLVWNVVAGRRWELYGQNVVEGDLVLVGTGDDLPTSFKEDVDEDGEVIIQPGLDDSAATDGDFTRARPVSKKEAEDQKFGIDDVVLPLPGFDVLYPPNEVGDFYKEFMGSERGGHLDPTNMRRKWKDISLSGGYRKVMARVGQGMEWDVKAYLCDTQQLVMTDLERLGKGEEGNLPNADTTGTEGAQKVAVVLKFRLGSSTYATMALREMMKAGGVKSYKADFGRG